MKKILLGLSLIGLLVGCGSKKEEVKDKKIKIGMTQIIEHVALDETAEGFRKALNEAGYTEDKVEIEFQNAQGDFGTAQTIASSFVEDKKDLIFAISTPSAQAVYNLTKDIPIVISAITDPVAAGLTGDNITGTQDLTPVAKQVDLIKDLVPNAKTIGIIYTPSEENSMVVVRLLRGIAKEKGYNLVEKAVTNINEVSQALDVILEEVDVFYAHTDNIITAAIPIVVEKARVKNIPVINVLENPVKQGALASEAIDYVDSGYRAGKAAIEILEGKNPKDIPITLPENTKLFINETTMNNLGLTIPKKLKERAIIVK